MELILNKLNIQGTIIDYKFQSGYIYGICGMLRRDILKAILNYEKTILFSEDPTNSISVVPLVKYIDTAITAKEEITNVLKLKALEYNEYILDDLLKRFNLNLEIMNKRIGDLTFYEQKALLIASALIVDSKIIILDSIEKNLPDKIKDNLKKYLKNIAKDKIIVLLSNDISFMFDLVDYYFLIEPKKYIIGTKKEFFNPDVYNYLTKPNIVEFIDYIKHKHRIAEYTDLKELLKAIYRDIENKS